MLNALIGLNVILSLAYIIMFTKKEKIQTNANRTYETVYAKCIKKKKKKKKNMEG